jgi:hypothetical protein
VTRLRLAMASAATAAVVAGLLGIGVQATDGGNAAVDEPQYLLTALSLWEDRNLDISDELAERRYHDFFTAELPVQTGELADGRALSPHDPLLPLVLAVPVGLAGWIGAKVALALLAGVLAALLVWVAVRRFDVPVVVAGVGAALAGASPPLAVYAHQLYPEIAAALVLLAGVAMATGPMRRRALVGLAVAVTALPWLSVKYLPVAAALAVVVLLRLVRERRPGVAAWFAGGLAVSGLVYLLLHWLLWGGWTVYATGDHFAQTGEFSVVGVEPDYLGRTLRLVALFSDRAYGLVVWQPAWLLAVPALAALIAWGGRTPTGHLRAAVAAPLLAGWAVATWPALTMHGFWWPGRQVVVVLPLAALAVLWWIGRVVPRWRPVALIAAAAGVVHQCALLVDGWFGDFTWVMSFGAVDDLLYRVLRPIFPDYRSSWSEFWLAHSAWMIVFFILLAAGAHSARRSKTPADNHLEEGILVR